MRNNVPIMFLFTLILGLGLFLSACTSPPEARIQEDSQQSAEGTATQIDNPSDAEVGGLGETVLTEDTTESNVDVEEVNPKTGLKATDPTTVKLASGDIQLVEFFAFW